MSEHVDISKNTKAWAVLQHSDISKNMKPWVVSQDSDASNNTKATLKCCVLTVMSYVGDYLEP